MNQAEPTVDKNPAMNMVTGAKLTVVSRKLERVRRVHAFMILVPPIAGTALAAALAWEHGVSRTALALLAVFFYWTFIGITVGYHRHFTHKSFQSPAFVRFLLGVAGSMACQGPVNYWVSNHRRHHMFTDKDEDIHSPHVFRAKRLGFWSGFWHSHVAWTFNHQISNTAVAAPDLIRDPVARRVNETYYLWVVLSFLIPTVVGGLVAQSWYGALEGLLWGGAVRLFLTYHWINTITSLAHIFGYQDFANGDQSRNNIWLCLPTMGESWHNNHHSFPGSAAFGLRWWQVDLGLYVIYGLRVLGLASDIKRPPSDLVAQKSIRNNAA
jgi:stearoyl-CoA desaturase (delta-9 desaturase)